MACFSATEYYVLLCTYNKCSTGEETYSVSSPLSTNSRSTCYLFYICYIYIIYYMTRRMHSSSSYFVLDYRIPPRLRHLPCEGIIIIQYSTYSSTTVSVMGLCKSRLLTPRLGDSGIPCPGWPRGWNSLEEWRKGGTTEAKIQGRRMAAKRLASMPDDGGLLFLLYLRHLPGRYIIYITYLMIIQPTDDG